MKKREINHVTINTELIEFCQGTGACRKGIENMRGKDLMTRQQIDQGIVEYENIATQHELARDEQEHLNILKDAQIFKNSDHFVFLKGKGGRERLAPIIGPNKDQIVDRIKNTPADEKVWQHISKNADIHSCRADYAKAIYKEYARNEVWHCRKDEKGEKLDKRAMYMVSKALGHSRIEVIANNYLRRL